MVNPLSILLPLVLIVWTFPAFAQRLTLLNKQNLGAKIQVTVKIPWEPGYDMVSTFYVDCKSGKVTAETGSSQLPFAPSTIIKIRGLACKD